MTETGAIAVAGLTAENRAIDEALRRIRQARIDRGWSQADLANAMNTSTNAIARMERGDVELRLGTVLRISRLTGVPVWALVPDVPPDDSTMRISSDQIVEFLHSVALRLPVPDKEKSKRKQRVSRSHRGFPPSLKEETQ